ncbi:DUF4224 domain-containing protein [Neisseria sp. S1]|uniref:DUF4224 domain-containing protein n=1 Tax=Neisseria sp. S1 TaxID=3318354 RepID=UPI003A896984
MGIFLSPGEIEELTAYKRHGKQIEALRAMGIPCMINQAGRPIVVRAVIEGVSSKERPQTDGRWKSKKAK